MVCCFLALKSAMEKFKDSLICPPWLGPCLLYLLKGKLSHPRNDDALDNASFSMLNMRIQNKSFEIDCLV